MLKHNNIKYKLNNRMSNVNKIIQVGLLLHIMVVILKNHDHFDLGLANLLFSQYPQVHTQTNFGAVITIDKSILHVYMPH